MALRKILESDMQGKGNVGRNNPPGLSVAEMQRVLDELVREVTAPIFNENIDTLQGAGGAASLGAADGRTIQDHLDEAAEGAALQAHIADKENPHQVTKAQVGLGNADNTADADKPVSVAQQAALDKKADKTAMETALAGKADKAATETALGKKADKTAVDAALALKADKTELAGKADQTDLESLAQTVAGKADKTALDKKVDKVAGKGLSTNDYTTAEKEKVAVIDTSGTGNRYLANDGTYKTVSGGGGTGGVSDYKDLSSLPQINGVTLLDNKTSDDLRLQPAGDYASAGDLSDLSATVAGKADQAAVTASLAGKVDKETGKGLSANDYTNEDKAAVGTISQKAGKPITVSATLTAAGWAGENAPYTQTVSIPAVTGGAAEVVLLAPADTATDAQWGEFTFAQVRKVAAAAGSVTLTASGQKPTGDIPLSVTILH